MTLLVVWGTDPTCFQLQKHTECWKCDTISGVGHGPYMFPTLKAHQVLDLCPLWCIARTSYVFKSISLTKDISEQDTRGHSRTATSMHQRDKTHDAQACLDSPQHLQRSFLCCYAWHVSVRLRSSLMSTTIPPNEHKKRAAWRSFCCLPARTWVVSSRRRFEIRPLSPIVGRAILQHLLTVARRV